MRTKLTLAPVAALAACASTSPHDHAHRHEHPHGHAHHAHPEGMQHDFSDAERWAREFDAPERDAWQQPDRVVAALGLRPGDTVVDLGVGTGYFVPRLAAAVGPEGHVIGLDVEPNMVSYVKARAQKVGLSRFDARVIAADDPQLAEGSADVILIVDTWHHLGARATYAEKLARALKPGGRVVVVDFKLESERGPPPTHRLAAEAVIAELATAGLEGEVADVALPDQYVVVARRP